jgi:hypothetical protein
LRLSPGKRFKLEPEKLYAIRVPWYFQLLEEDDDGSDLNEEEDRLGRMSRGTERARERTKDIVLPGNGDARR